jgi:hypothetical protein
MTAWWNDNFSMVDSAHPDPGVVQRAVGAINAAPLLGDTFLGLGFDVAFLFLRP